MTWAFADDWTQTTDGAAADGAAAWAASRKHWRCQSGHFRNQRRPTTNRRRPTEHGATTIAAKRSTRSSENRRWWERHLDWRCGTAGSSGEGCTSVVVAAAAVGDDRLGFGAAIANARRWVCRRRLRLATGGGWR